jgi:hypothetical protein
MDVAEVLDFDNFDDNFYNVNNVIGISINADNINGISINGVSINPCNSNVNANSNSSIDNFGNNVGTQPMPISFPLHSFHLPSFPLPSIPLPSVPIHTPIINPVTPVVRQNTIRSEILIAPATSEGPKRTSSSPDRGKGGRRYRQAIPAPIREKIYKMYMRSDCVQKDVASKFTMYPSFLSNDP